MNPLKNFIRALVEGYRNLSIEESTQKSIVLDQPQIQPLKIPVEAVQKIVVESPEQPIKIPIQPVIQPIVVPIKTEEEKEEKELVKETEGIEIPKFSPALVKTGEIEEEEREKITLIQPLIPKKPQKDEPILAYAKIYWDEKENRQVYQVVEPPLTNKLKEILRKVKEIMEQKLDVEFSRLKVLEAKEYLRKQISDIVGYFGFKLSETEKQILQYYIERDFMGLGKIEPLMNDDQIEDISCDGVKIPVFVFHRNPALGSLITNVVFENEEELDSFVMRLAQLCGKSISITNPLLSGSLPDGSRVQATLATDIARRGSNFTIRKFTEKPLTPVHLLGYKTVDIKALAYLWFVVDMGKSVLVSGGTASGKTSMLNVLSLFIRPEQKIVSIEDTPELKLPHPHWVPHVARTAIGTEFGRKPGEIDLFDLLKESLRQRPDYIIVGEVRGKEAYVLFQEMATGHPSLATIHAENISKLLDRLTTPPISLPPSLIASVDVIVFMVLTRYRNKQVRRVTEILEVVGIDEKTKTPIFNKLFKWNPVSDSFDVCGKSFLLKKISESTGLSEKEIKEELERRMLVLDWLQTNNILEYEDFCQIINSYYKNPSRLLAAIKGGLG
ncbi:MAG: type II/IV secretion system ATPase subunit [Candidatus Aenigmatarchaeota archaeon]